MTFLLFLSLKCCVFNEVLEFTLQWSERDIGGTSFLLCYCCLNRRLFISALLMVVMAVSLQWKRSSYYKNSRHSIFWTVLHTGKSTIRGLTTFFHLLFSSFFYEILRFLHYCGRSFNQTFTSSTTLFLLRPPDQISRGSMQEFHKNPLISVLMDTISCLRWFFNGCKCCLVSIVSSILVLLWCQGRDGVKSQ